MLYTFYICFTSSIVQFYQWNKHIFWWETDSFYFLKIVYYRNILGNTIYILDMSNLGILKAESNSFDALWLYCPFINADVCTILGGSGNNSIQKKF